MILRTLSSASSPAANSFRTWSSPRCRSRAACSRRRPWNGDTRHATATSATILRSTRSGSTSPTEVSPAARNSANSRMADAFRAAAAFSADWASVMASSSSRSRTERESTMCSILPRRSRNGKRDSEWIGKEPMQR